LSATIRLSAWFSRSSSLSRLTSSAFIPPNWARQRWYVGSETSSALATSGTSAPSASILSASLSLRMICSGVCRRRFTSSVLLSPMIAGG
jgi:hypothetical protein